MTISQRRWDIFCRVIDNYGDIGVSWRLARQLAAEHGVVVRLWVDCMESLRALCPAVTTNAARQSAEGVEVFHFAETPEWAHPADVVIEAFGCGLPERYVSALAACRVKPLWIVLEYLSAEPWVREHHGLPSPHPQLGLPRHFFFPGFADGTGGVLREADLLVRRDAFDARARRDWWSRAGFGDVGPDVLAVSLFAYPHALVDELLDACRSLPSPVVVAIPEGPIARRLREEGRRSDDRVQLRFLPFFPQTEYDRLLWACDINFVRGEDSFVRAQWAGRPFIWHIYPQAQDAHLVKLEAFLDLYLAGLAPDAASAVRDFWHAWNGATGAPPLAEAFHAFCRWQGVQRQHLVQWQQRLAGIGDAAANLVKFSQKMI